MVVPDATICVGFNVMVTPLTTIVVALVTEGGVKGTPTMVTTIWGGGDGTGDCGGGICLVVVGLTTGCGGFVGGGNDGGGGGGAVTVTGILSVSVTVDVDAATVDSAEVEATERVTVTQNGNGAEVISVRL
jgi:hypothetical protein